MKFITRSWGLAALLLAAAAASPCRADETTLSLDAGSGNGSYTGTLTVSLSNGDWTGANWAFGGAPLGASVAVPGASGMVNIGLQLVSGTPGQLYISGSAGAAAAPGAGGDFVAGPSGGPSAPTSLQNALNFQILDAGFYVPLSWDGSTNAWVGTYQVAFSTSVPDSGNAGALLALALGGLAARRYLGPYLRRRPARAGRR